MFSQQQKDVLVRSGVSLSQLTEEEVFRIANKDIEVESLNDKKLIEFLRIANATYRGGVQIISDADYDFIYIAELSKRQPTHPFLHHVEPEAAFEGKTVRLPVKMLSTQKAYTRNAIENWATRIRKAALEIGIDPDELVIKVTPKLDGFAAYDDGLRLYTRGDGIRGTDVTRVFVRGLKIYGDGKRGHGAGEIVVDKDYFINNLSHFFENSRNFQAAILAEKKIDERVQYAIDSGAALFAPFSQLPSWKGKMQDLLNDFETILAEARSYVNYDVDGVVIESTDLKINEYMGATQDHHKWQIAYKTNVEKAEVKVIKVVPNTSRTGRVNPIAELEPTRLGGVTITWVTAHHYKKVEKEGIGTGAKIVIVRSGNVIPKIEEVKEPAKPEIPSVCPTCQSELVWDKDYLYCPNTSGCSAQVENTMIHFFKALGNVDGFGPSTIHKLYLNGVDSVYNIYQMSLEDFIKYDFGEKTAQNLIEQLNRSRMEPLEDWRFLAAFGVFRLGEGNSQKILQQYKLLEVFSLTEGELKNTEGIDESAKAIVEGLHKIKDQFVNLYNLHFNIQRTPLISEQRELGTISQISGKQILFTGEMEHGTRAEMEVEARKLGAKIGTSVSGKTDFLIVGNNVGQKKITAAQEKGVKIISESEYLSMIRR